MCQLPPLESEVRGKLAVPLGYTNVLPEKVVVKSPNEVDSAPPSRGVKSVISAIVGVGQAVPTATTPPPPLPPVVDVDPAMGVVPPVPAALLLVPPAEVPAAAESSPLSELLQAAPAVTRVIADSPISDALSSRELDFMCVLQSWARISGRWLIDGDLIDPDLEISFFGNLEAD